MKTGVLLLKKKQGLGKTHGLAVRNSDVFGFTLACRACKRTICADPRHPARWPTEGLDALASLAAVPDLLRFPRRFRQTCPPRKNVNGYYRSKNILSIIFFLFYLRRILTV